MATNIAETVRVLVVSRESAVLRALWTAAEPNSWNVETVASTWEAIERVQSGVTPHVLLLDVPRGDEDSLHVLRWFRRLRPNLPVIVILSSEDIGRDREVTRLGAQDVLIKPFDSAELESLVQRHLIAGSGEAEIESEDIEQLGPDSFFLSASPVTQKLRAQAELLAEADVPVLILGEQGSGKDTVAKLIHKLSVRSGFQFLKVNCANMPADLLEHELFGNEKASSFGTNRAPGKIQRAEKGTIFLDEITEMPLSLQKRLIEILQDKVMPRSGSDKNNAVDVRILAATSANLDEALTQKKLREDLYYRLSAFTVQVPSLRQRKSEIPVLLQHSMHQMARHYGLPSREFSPMILQECQQHSWPGNLKELQSFVKRYLVAGDTEVVVEDFATNGENGATPSQATIVDRTLLPFGGNGNQEPGSRSLKSLVQDLKWDAERKAIGSALQKTGWNRKAAARLLQVSYRTLLYKIDQYHMSTSENFAPVPEEKFSLQGTGSRSNGKES